MDDQKLTAVLMVEYGDIAGNKEFLIVDVISIGRDSQNTIVIPNTNVSRKHAKVYKNFDGKYEVEDLGSHNGTLLNGRLARKELLQDGDVINIADVNLTFKMISQDAPFEKTDGDDNFDNPLEAISTEFIDLTELEKDNMKKLRQDKPSITNHWED